VIGSIPFKTRISAAFWSLLFGVFCFWGGAIAVASSLVEYYTEVRAQDPLAALDERAVLRPMGR